MKVIKSDANSNIVGVDFDGLCLDKEGAIWLFGTDGACCFIDEEEPAVFYRVHELEKALEIYGPFTVFTGSVTISN